MKYQFENTTARDGNPVLLVSDGGKTMRLNSAYRPMEEAKKWASQYDTKHLGVLILVFGVGNGIFLNALLEQCEDDAKVIVYEPCPELPKLEMPVFPESVRQGITNGRFDLVTPESEMSFFQILNERMTWEGKKLSVVHPHYDSLYPEEYRKFQTEISDAKKRVEAQKNTANAFGKKILKNQFYLLNRIRELYFLSDFMQIDRKKPVVITASGPSLADSIDDLKENREAYLLMAVDSSVNFLLNRDIIPDCIVTIDPNKYPKHLGKEQAKKIPLFCRMDSNFKIIKDHEAPLIVIGSSSFAAGILKIAGHSMKWLEDTGGSVSTAAYAICEAMGFETIILVGQDLCYRMRDAQTIEATHANGKISPDEKKQGFDRGYIEGNTEPKVLTRQDWYRYLKWFEDKIKISRVKVINATVGGAKIPGARYLSFIDAIAEGGVLAGSGNVTGQDVVAESDTLAGGDCVAGQDTLAEGDKIVCGHTITGEGNWQMQNGIDFTHGTLSESDYQKMEAILTSFPNQLEEMKQKTQSVIEISRILSEKARKRVLGQAPEDQKQMQKISAINQWMEAQLLYEAVDLLIPRDASDEINEIGKDSMDDLRITYEQVEKIYRKIEAALGELGELMSETEKQ